MKRSREQWRQIVEDYESSGMSAAAFARQEGLNRNTFSWWRTQLRKEARTSGARLTLVSVSDAATRRRTEPVVIRFADGTELCVPVGTEPSWVGRLADTLR
ncbi:MAG: transposase [Myxococcota bacterium]